MYEPNGNTNNSKQYGPGNAKKGQLSHGMKKPPSEIIPKSTDILFGRGTNSNEHKNKNYHNLIGQHFWDYKNTNDNEKKRKIVKSIVDSVKNQGGTFLNREKRSKPWYVVDEEAVDAKVKQALRDRGNANKKYNTKKRARSDEPPELQDEKPTSRVKHEKEMN